MQTVTVAAIRSFSHGGRAFSCGESVTLSALQASILGRQGLVSLVKGETGLAREETPAPQPEPVVAASTPTPEVPAKKTRQRRGRYARKDMRAEGAE